jgi:RNA polymerase sigma-70 factor (ECF subfamily)
MELPISTIEDSASELEHAFANRERWAFDAAYRSYARALYGAAFGVLRDQGRAQECVQDVMARLWRGPNPYRPARGALAAFLTVCVRNEALSRLRRDRNRSRIDASLATDERRDEDFGDPIERERLARAVAALGDEQRETVLLAYARHMTLDEIARERALPLGTVKSRLSSALRALRVALGKDPA